MACISPIKGKGNGQHSNCSICYIDEIKEEKKSKLEENIQYLEFMSNKTDESINCLKKIFDEKQKEKENLKFKIQTIFNKIKKELNKREEEFFSEIDEIYTESYFSDDLIKKSRILSKKIQESIEECKEIIKKWDEQEKLSLCINTYLNIETNIKNINNMHENIENSQIIKKSLYFKTNDNKINDIFEKIKNFGEIKCSKIKNEKKEQEISIKNLNERQTILKEKLKKKSLKKSKIKEKLQIEEKII